MHLSALSFLYQNILMFSRRGPWLSKKGTLPCGVLCFLLFLTTHPRWQMHLITVLIHIADISSINFFSLMLTIFFYWKICFLLMYFIMLTCYRVYYYYALFMALPTASYKLSARRCVEYGREYSVIYRGPYFFRIVWFISTTTPL